MPFISKTWVDDQIVYSEDMNRIEQGIAETDTLLREKVNPNLLDNPYFANPVNQRGKTEQYGGGYFIDRWTASEGKYALTNNGLTLCVEGVNSWIAQLLDVDVEGQIITVSALTANGKLYVGTGRLTKQSAVSRSIDGGGYVSCSYVTGISTFQFILARYDTTLPITILAAKLELGSQQTLAHQDANGNWVLNEIPDYSEQLLRCCMSKADTGDPYANNKMTAKAVGAASVNEFFNAVNMLAPDSTGCATLFDYIRAKYIEGKQFIVGFIMNFPDMPQTGWGYSMIAQRSENDAWDVQIRKMWANDILVRQMNTNSGWMQNGWTKLATTDYAVNKAGDTMTGKLVTSKSHGAFGAASNDIAFRIDGGTDYNNGAFLTLYGKEHSESGQFQLVASNDSGRIELRGRTDGILLWDNKTILHTGNKPSGSYTGNGSSVERTIEVGGLGDAIFIRSTNDFALVCYNGAILKVGTSVSGITQSEVKYENGVLTMRSTKSALNTSGVIYYYQVL